ncbi:hypothetical protein MAR_037728, partial [Mya arenaria]
MCTMLNMTFTHSLTSWYGPGKAPMLVDNLDCFTTNLSQCTHRSPYRGGCIEGYVLSLFCSECGEANLSHGKITSYHNRTLTVECDEGYDPSTISLQCVNAAWSRNATCIP